MTCARTPAEARCALCVFAAKRGRLRLWPRLKERFWALFFPWFYRRILYRNEFCVADFCMHWQWSDAAKTRGVCGASIRLGRRALEREI